MTLKQQVENLLRDTPQTRNDDVLLTLFVWQRYYGVEQTIDVQDLFKLPREDNIKRIRATIQNDEGRYLPTDPSVIKKRRINEEKWRKQLGYDTREDSASKILDEQLTRSPQFQQKIADEPKPEPVPPAETLDMFGGVDFGFPDPPKPKREIRDFG